MTRYNIVALDEAFGASDDHVKIPDIEKIFDTLDRAPWWEKVGVGYKFSEGEPLRREEGHQYAEEYLVVLPLTITKSSLTYFRDTRWTPPTKPLQVGDVVETAEDLERLPTDSGVVDGDEDLIQRKEHGWVFAGVSGRSYSSKYLIAFKPLTIVYLPKAGGDA